MPLDFDLKHAFWAVAGSAVGAIAGYLFGIVLYIVMIASSAFSSNGSIAAAASNAGVFPMLFAVTLAAVGFFGGYYISSNGSAPKTAA